MSLNVNGVPAASMTWCAGWSGVWAAQVEIHHGETSPTGRVAITTAEGIALSGTVDPKHSGSFGEKRHLRVIAGGNGWSKTVRAQHFHSDVGLTMQVLASATAAEAGEVVTVLAPMVVGLDFARRNAPASQIFTDAGVDWWVGLDGVTRVGARVPVVQPPSLEVLDWDPEAATVRFTASVLVEPGTVIVDDRFGRRIVREVEATVSNGAVTGTLWVVEASPTAGTVSELTQSFAELAREATRIATARVYEYRVIAMAGSRVELQAVSKADGVPDILPASVWGGISGYRAELRPASRVLVGFIAGDPRRPYVAAYEPPEADGWRPVKLELDAVASVEIGESAAVTNIGGPTATGVVTQASFAALMVQFVTFLTASQAFYNFPGIAAISGGTAQPAAAAAAALAITAALPTNYSTRARAAS